MHSSYLRLVACLILSWSFTVAAAGVTIDGDLFLGVWSPMQSRWESRVPVCVSGDSDQAPYRVLAAGAHSENFAMANELGDQVRYNVFWHTGKNYQQREALKTSVASRKVYVEQGGCQIQPSGYIRVRLNKRDIDNAIPAIYQDTLVVMLSPL